MDRKYPMSGAQNTMKMQAVRRYESLGLFFGISSSNYSLTQTGVRNDLVLLPYSLYELRSPVLNQFMLYQLLRGDERVFMNITTADVGFTYNFHFAYTEPYLVIGVGGGTCSQGCAAAKGFGGFGIRLLLGNSYLFMEGLGQEILIHHPDRKLSPASEGLFQFGMGVHL